MQKIVEPGWKLQHAAGQAGEEGLKQAGMKGVGWVQTPPLWFAGPGSVLVSHRPEGLR